MESNLVVADTFLSKIDAELAVSALEAAGIDAMVRTDDCGGVRPSLWMGGVAVLVRAEDADRAREVLSLVTEPGVSEFEHDVGGGDVERAD